MDNSEQQQSTGLEDSSVEVDQQDGGPGSRTEDGTGGEVDDAASGGVSNETDVHGQPDQVS